MHLPVVARRLHFRTDAESSTSRSPFVSGCSGTITWKGKSSAKALQQADTTRELRAGNS
jgi:hypothetical protein